MLAKITSGATIGLTSVPVIVEVDVSSGSLPSFTIVGLPDKAVEESRERVRSALKNSGAQFPSRRITINLAPADLPKEGPSYDLPMALGILIASGQLEVSINDSLFFGELSLDGSLRHTKGILPLTMLAKEHGFKKVFLPAVNAQEAAVIEGIEIYPIATVKTLFSHLTNQETIEPHAHVPFSTLNTDTNYHFDMSDVKGQEFAKRALEIAAAGGHNCILTGPPGAGKTLLARSFPSILPELTEDEALEVTKIYSVTGNLKPGESLVKIRPFRHPHHTTSRIGLIGGGTNPIPGEISLAHRGVLFMDELAEFPRSVLEALRQPLEDGVVTISRASGSATYPAQFTLVAASNPCPCGYFGSTTKTCLCNPGQIIRYQKRLSGPILDRIDIHVSCPALSPEKLSQLSAGESSVAIRARVQAARNFQLQRFRGRKLKNNAEMTSKDIKDYCQLSAECLSLLRQAVNTLYLSARGYHKVIKIARTIADLNQAEELLLMHLAEAFQYRPKSQEFH